MLEAKRFQSSQTVEWITGQSSLGQWDGLWKKCVKMNSIDTVQID